MNSMMGLMISFSRSRGELVRVDRGDDADRRGDEDRDEGNDERTRQQRHEAEEVLPGAVGDPLRAEEERGDDADHRNGFVGAPLIELARPHRAFPSHAQGASRAHRRAWRWPQVFQPACGSDAEAFSAALT
jgi:hypothetical protein